MNRLQLRRAFAKSKGMAPPRDVPGRPAAVLVPLEPERGVWLTRRGMAMTAHAGQVSFPGGKIEPSDGSARVAALREAQEEIGLDPACVEFVGRLPVYETATGFNITPVVGIVPEHVVLAPVSEEVSEIFALPFSVLLNPDYPLQREAFWHGARRRFWLWPHEEQIIWGATAAILRHVALDLRAAL